VFGAVIARGEDYRTVFQHFCPGFDLDTERQARLDAGRGEYLNADDLYPRRTPLPPHPPGSRLLRRAFRV
jgi:hypothetical protein